MNKHCAPHLSPELCLTLYTLSRGVRPCVHWALWGRVRPGCARKSRPLLGSLSLHSPQRQRQGQRAREAREARRPERPERPGREPNPNSPHSCTYSVSSTLGFHSSSELNTHEQCSVVIISAACHTLCAIQSSLCNTQTMPSCCAPSCCAMPSVMHQAGYDATIRKWDTQNAEVSPRCTLPLSAGPW